MEYIIVQAGGKGTRLGHLTQNKPKALLPVENLPMLFHLFRKYPDRRFIIIADYQKEVLREYLAAFADVKYQIVDAEGTGTCAGIRQALSLIPDRQPFMLIWSDLILPEEFRLPKEYEDREVPTEDSDKQAPCADVSTKADVMKCPQNDYIGISAAFPCRWSYRDGGFKEEPSCENGVAGFFLFTDKSKLQDTPFSGELVRWMQSEGIRFREISLAGTREFGLLEEYRRLERVKCRPFNRITIEGDVLVKEALDAQGGVLAKRECAWYDKAESLIAEQAGDMGEDVSRADTLPDRRGCHGRCQGNPGAFLPAIYSKNPLKMEYIRGQNLYECDLDREGKQRVLRKLVSALDAIHDLEQVPADSFSMKEAYYRKTMDRLSRVEDLVPFARDREILINGKKCRNVFFHKRELEKKLEQLTCTQFCFIHGDCTFSNLLLREDGTPVLIDPRGYFGFTDFYGDVRYDWAKLYYSIVGNYDRFNLKDFRLDITEQGATLDISSNHWEDMEEDFFELTGAEKEEIRLLHAIIWLSLTTYAWQDYDSVCGAFYNGLYYLEDIL